MRLATRPRSHVRDKRTAGSPSCGLHVIIVPTPRSAATKTVRLANVVSTPTSRATIAPRNAWASLHYQSKAETASSRPRRPQEGTAKPSLVVLTPTLKVAMVRRTIRSTRPTRVSVPTDKTSILLPRGTMRTSWQICPVLLTLPISPIPKRMLRTLRKHN